MKDRLRFLYFGLRSSIWALPVALALVGLAGALATLQIDHAYGPRLLMEWLPGTRLTVEGARSILSTIAGTVITVASLIFSLTLVALTLVSQQLGPRVLQFFMEDNTTKLVLGVFIGTFVYTLIVLGSVGSRDADVFVPQLSVHVAITQSLIAFGLVVYFLHHIVTNIQADVVVAALGDDLKTAISDALEGGETAEWISERELDRLKDQFDGREFSLRVSTSGYLQSVNEGTACALANEHDLTIRFSKRPGEFVLSGEVLLNVCPIEKVTDEVIEALAEVFRTGPLRTREQHVDFELNALVEVALRALSPGVNDPYTAMTCIDRLADALAALFAQKGDVRVHKQDDRVCIISAPTPFSHAINLSFHPIRQASSAQMRVLLKLLGSLTTLASLACTSAQLAAIEDHGEATIVTGEKAAFAEVDAGEIREMGKQFRAAVQANRARAQEMIC